MGLNNSRSLANRMELGMGTPICLWGSQAIVSAWSSPLKQVGLFRHQAVGQSVGAVHV